MNRRGFLKLVGVLVLAPSIPLPKPSDHIASVTPRRAEWGCGCPRCKARRALAKWSAEKVDEDIIAALSGIREAA